MKSIRSRLSYANVISTLALFLVLGGGAAIAATELEPNSVGTVHLKPQAVTAVKIKREAVIASRIADENVTTAKLAGGAVTTDRIADGAVTSDRIADGAVTSDRIADGAIGTGKIGNGAVTLEKLAADIPFARVQRIRGTGAVSFPKQGSVAYPLDNPTFTQPAGETHLYVASGQVLVPDNCDPASASADLLIDAGRDRFADEQVGRGTFVEQSGQPGTYAFQFAASDGGHGVATSAPTSPTQHTFSIVLRNASCNGLSNTADRIRMTGAQVDVIGIR